MRERPTSGRPPANRAMAGTVQLLHDQYSTDIATLERVAEGIRALPHVVGQPVPDDFARLRREFERILGRLRTAGYEEVRRAC